MGTSYQVLCESCGYLPCYLNAVCIPSWSSTCSDNVSVGPGGSASEDFSAYTATIPGCFMVLGGGTAEDGFPYKNHNPEFNIVEGAMANAVRVEVQIILDMIGQ